MPTIGSQLMHDVTFLTFDSVQEGVGANQISAVVRQLSEIGVDISLVSMEKQPPSSETRAEMSSAGVDWLALPFGSFGQIGGIKRVLRLMQALPPSRLVHCRSDLPVIAALARRRPFIWDVRSLWSDQRVAIGAIASGGVQHRALLKLESIAYRRCSAMMTLTDAVVPILEGRYGTRDRPRAIMPTCVDLERFQPAPLPRRGTLHVLLSGTYNNYYDLELTGDLIQALRAQQEVHVTWARGAEAGRQHLSFVDQVLNPTRHELVRLIQESHVGVSICRADAGPSLAAAVPTKIAEFLSCGRPVIVNKGLGDCDSLVSAGVAVCVESSQVQVAVDSINIVLENPDIEAQCREIATQDYSLGQATQTLAAVYDQVLRKGTVT